MKKISKEEIKILYATASSAGLVDNSRGHEDEFHQLVFGETGKESIKELTHQEFIIIKSRLDILTDKATDGMITIRQKQKIYATMKELIKLSPSDVPKAERLCGIIRKTLKISSFPSEPLRWVRKKEATKLIQTLGFYIDNEKKKLGKGDVKSDEHR